MGAAAGTEYYQDAGLLMKEEQAGEVEIAVGTIADGADSGVSEGPDQFAGGLVMLDVDAGSDGVEEIIGAYGDCLRGEGRGHAGPSGDEQDQSWGKHIEGMGGTKQPGETALATKKR